MATEDTLLDISAEVSSSEDFITEEAPLLAFRVIGCTFVTILVGFTIIIYVTSGMTHMDCLAQIYGEFCILSAYMLILLTTTEPSKINKNMCITISFFLHICFVGAFFFSLLEVMCICQVLVPFFQRRAFLNSIYISFGWMCPIFIAVITVLIWLKEFLGKSNCWVDLNKPLMWPTVIPIGTCIGLQTILLFIVFFLTDMPISVPESEYNRAKLWYCVSWQSTRGLSAYGRDALGGGFIGYGTIVCLLGTRWASAIILITLTAAWICGVLAYNRRQETLYAAFTVSSILLGVCIFTLRISTDDEIRSIITADLLCCLIPKNKVTSLSMKQAHLKKTQISESRNGLINGKINENENSDQVFHK